MKRKKMMLEGQIRHTKKCDADNLAKAVLDALNGIAYYDDSQVCELSVSKLYSDNPRVIVSISEI
jgi:Holliday junction resolvase RusA-like endonuclease